MEEIMIEEATAVIAAIDEVVYAACKFVEIHDYIPDDALKYSGETVCSGYSLLKLREAVAALNINL